MNLLGLILSKIANIFFYLVQKNAMFSMLFEQKIAFESMCSMFLCGSKIFISVWFKKSMFLCCLSKKLLLNLCVLCFYVVQKSLFFFGSKNLCFYMFCKKKRY